MPKLKGQINVKIQMPKPQVLAPELNRPVCRMLHGGIRIFLWDLSLGFDLNFGFQHLSLFGSG
jgi:hypothetical protein